MRLYRLAAAVLALGLLAGAEPFPPSRSGLSFDPSLVDSRRPPPRQGRDANSNLAFLGFIMALLDTVINIVSMINNNNNNNNNNDNNNNNNDNNLNSVDVNSMNMNNNMVMGKMSGWSWLDEVMSSRLEAIWRWSKAIARHHPTCITRLVCETHRMSDHHSGLTYLVTTFLSSASSFLLAEAFQPQLSLSDVTEAARFGRQRHNCYPLQCRLL